MSDVTVQTEQINDIPLLIKQQQAMGIYVTNNKRPTPFIVPDLSRKIRVPTKAADTSPETAPSGCRRLAGSPG